MCLQFFLTNVKDFFQGFRVLGVEVFVGEKAGRTGASRGGSPMLVRWWAVSKAPLLPGCCPLPHLRVLPATLRQPWVEPGQEVVDPGCGRVRYVGGSRIQGSSSYLTRGGGGAIDMSVDPGSRAAAANGGGVDM